MEVSSREKIELATYQLKGVAQVWFTQWASKRVDELWIGWEELKIAFLDYFFPLGLKDAKLIKFINLKQGTMSVKKHALKFIKLSKYAPTLVVDPRAMMKNLFQEFMTWLWKSAKLLCLWKR